MQVDVTLISNVSQQSKQFFCVSSFCTKPCVSVEGSMPCARRWADYADDTDDDCVPPASFSISIQKLMVFKHDKMSQRKNRKPYGHDLKTDFIRLYKMIRYGI